MKLTNEVKVKFSWQNEGLLTSCSLLSDHFLSVISKSDDIKLEFIGNIELKPTNYNQVYVEVSKERETKEY